MAHRVVNEGSDDRVPYHIAVMPVAIVMLHKATGLTRPGRWLADADARQLEPEKQGLSVRYDPIRQHYSRRARRRGGAANTSYRSNCKGLQLRLHEGALVVVLVLGCAIVGPRVLRFLNPLARAVTCAAHERKL